MRELVIGGARSGKSTFAESLVAAASGVDYVATSAVAADDPEWVARIATHRARRPGHWRTIETLDLAGVLTSDADAPVLIDCLTLWLARTMDAAGAWDASPDRADALASEVTALVAALSSTQRDVVLVTNEVGQGVVPSTFSGRLFRDQMGVLNARAAAACDRVWLVTAGLPLRIKG